MARSVLITNPGDADDLSSPFNVVGVVAPHDQTVTVSLFRPGAGTPTVTSAPITPDPSGHWFTTITVTADGEYLVIAQQTGLPITHSVSITVSAINNPIEKRKPPMAAAKKKPAKKKPKPAKKPVKAKGKKKR